MENIWEKKMVGLKTFIMALLSAIALIGEATIPTSEAVEKLTGGLANPVLRFVAKLRLVMPDKGILGFLVLIGLWILYGYNFSLKKGRKKYFSKAFLALSVLFSLIMIAGMSFKKFDSFAFVFESKFQMVYSFVLFVGFSIFFMELFEICSSWIGRMSSVTLQENNLWTFLLDKHSIAGPLCFCLICWLPYWIAYFPGSAMWDAFRQLNYYFGIEKWSDHHPVFSTMIYGGLMQFGRTIGNDNTGIFLCALLQHILFCGSVTYGMYILKKWNVPQKIRMWLLLFFAFCPLIAFWPHSVMKDVAFDALILIYTIFVLDLIRELKEGKASAQKLICVGMAGVLASLMRHNGIYIVLASVLFLVCIKAPQKVKLKIFSCAVLTLVCTMALSNVLIGAVGAVKGSSGLALSVPFQQTARYVKEHGDEVTEEERTAIDAVLNYDRLAEYYDPDISDPIKGTYKNDDSKLPAYIKVWFQMFLKHPMTYIEATISNSYTYFYPNGESTTKPLVYNTITKDPRINTGYFDIHYSSSHGEARNFLDGMLYVVKKTPGIGLICHMGTYTWLLLILITIGIYKKRGYLILGCLPALLNFLSCVASPVNGYLRYFLPNVLMIPILVGWFVAELAPEEKKKGGRTNGYSSGIDSVL